MQLRCFLLSFLLILSEHSLIAMKGMGNNMMAREIKVGSIYQHYSGKLYKVLAIAYDSENPELLRVIYQGLYDCPTFGKNPVWDRPYQMFAEQVVISGIQQYRFTEVIA